MQKKRRPKTEWTTTGETAPLSLSARINAAWADPYRHADTFLN